MAILFSFIIPHKNGDIAQLRRCLDSIPHREDVQIIIVDDCSDASVFDVGELKKLQDACTEVYWLETGVGPGGARNYALDRAKGEWIFFVDADDYYEKENLKRLLDLCTHSMADVVYMGYQVIADGQKKVNLNGYEEDGDRLYDLDDCERDAYLDAFYPWQKCLKRSLLNSQNLRFDELYLSEDRILALEALLSAKKVERFSSPVYNYVIHENSLTTSKPSYERTKGAVGVAIETNRILKRHDKLRIYRDKTSQRYLTILNEYNLVDYWCFILKEIWFLGWAFAMEDREYVCMCRGYKVNLLMQFVDEIRVKAGFLRNRLR